MTPAGVGKILPGDPGPALPGWFTETFYRDVLANYVQGVEGKPTKKQSRPDGSRSLLYKCHLSEKGRRRRAELNFNNEQAACIYQKNFRSNEPPPESAEKLTTAHFLKKISCSALPDKLYQSEACQTYLIKT